MKALYCIIVLIISTCLFSTIINVPAEQPTIQAGIDSAVDADTVLVQPGTYFENINYNGKLVTVASLFLTTQDTTYISQTIIDGNQNGSVVVFENYETMGAVLTGLTITNGYSQYGGGIYCYNSNPCLTNITIIGNSAFMEGLTISGFGGGIYCEQSNPTLTNVTITNNIAQSQDPMIGGAGGGIFCYNSNPILQNITISGNSATQNGGGIFCCDNSNPILQNTTISGNSATQNGGGIFCCDNSNPSLENVIILNNTGSYGGGIYCSAYSSPSLINVIISGNSADFSGGGIECYAYSNPSLVNVTITGNSTNSGGGIYCEYNSSPSLINCILWNDSPEEIYFHTSMDPNSISVSYSNIHGGEEGIITNNNGTVNWLEGNIDENPLFVETGDHPFMLQDLSPCVNAGIPDTTGLNLPEYDLAGNPRMFGGRIDMGAYENQNVIVGVDEDLITLVTKLNQNYPNPFNPTTTINYSLKENSKISLNIYNIKGQKVKQLVSDYLSVGQHSVVWNGKDDNGKSVSSGIYFYKLKTGNYEETKRMVLIK